MLRVFVSGVAAVFGLCAASHGASLLDASFDPGTGAGGGLVEQVRPLSDGRIMICGNFTSFDGHNKSYVARLNADGSVDESFHAQPGYWVRNLSVQSDGKIVIGGFFTTVAGLPRSLIARLNADGSLDTSFDPGAGAQDIIGGGIDGNNTPFVFWTAIQPDGKILITGNFKNYNGESSIGLARLNTDGSRDASFNVGGGLDSWGRQMIVQPNGQILLSGWFTSYHNHGFNRVARINADGSPDTTFAPFFGDKTAIYSTALTADGKIIAAGHSVNEAGLFHREMARLNQDGSIDESFVGFTNEKTESVVIQSDGKVIVGGYFTQANNAPRQSVARFHPDGTLDAGFAATIDNYVWSCALQSDGKLLISGGFYTVDGVSRGGVARLITGAPGGDPNPPQDVAPALSVSGATATSLSLSWSDSSTVRTGYDIELKTGDTYTAMASVGSAARSYTVTGRETGTAYTFRLKGHNALGSAVYSAEATGTTSSGGTGPAGAVVFVASDTATRGKWTGLLGAQGGNVFGDRASMPDYVTLTAMGKTDWIWKRFTQDPSALQRFGGSDPLAACWYAGTSFTIDLRFTDGQAHRTAIYFLDWDKMGRVQTVQVTDGSSGAILDSRVLNNFGPGVYLVWDFTGNVKITVTAQSGNAVASGIFFDAATTGSASGFKPLAAGPGEPQPKTRQEVRR